MTLPWHSPTEPELTYLERQGVLDAAVNVMPHVGAASVAFDGNLFEEVEDNQRALTFVVHDYGEFIDFAAWQPRTCQLATWRGAGFAIGQDQIFNPATYFDGGALRIHVDPLAWLKADREGIVIVKSELTPAFLANVTRLSFADPSYARKVERWLQPSEPRVELLVEVQEELAA